MYAGAAGGKAIANAATRGRSAGIGREAPATSLKRPGSTLITACQVGAHEFAVARMFKTANKVIRERFEPTMH
jgi:hypothetical protein